MADRLVQKRLCIKETFATVTAEERFLELAERTIAAARADIESYIAGQPRFLSSLEPLPVDMAAPPVARRMAAAAALAGVGPMAAVAGAIAQVTVEALVAAAPATSSWTTAATWCCDDRPGRSESSGPARIRDIALRCEPPWHSPSAPRRHRRPFLSSAAPTPPPSSPPTVAGRRRRPPSAASGKTRIRSAVRESLRVEGVLPSPANT
jgi:hypothetical protein